MELGQAKVFYIMGVSGSGKSYIGKAFAEAMGIDFFDGDDFHPPANVAKMSEGHPLEDQDRLGWLLAINKFANARLTKKSTVIACSALKESYRTLLSKDLNGKVHWIYLKGAFELIYQRMQQRDDHFMPSSLLQSQFDILEEPAEAVTIDISLKPAQIIESLTSLYFGN